MSKNSKGSKSLPVGVLGLWHLGCVYASSLAKEGFSVSGFDQNKHVIEQLSKGIPPIYEPGLNEEIKNHLNKNLKFSSNPTTVISNKKVIFVCLDVPVDDHDKLIIKPLNELFALVLKYCSSKTLVVVSSQVPVGTMRKLNNSLFKHNRSMALYFPENVRLGNAYETFLNPDRIVLGGNPDSILIFKNLFPFFKCPILNMSFESAEMAKHGINTWLAVNISFASELADVCENVNADYGEVVAALRSDSRIGNGVPLNAGTGFAGGTIGRDVQVIKEISKKNKYTPKLIEAAYLVNQNRLKRLMFKIETIIPKLKNKNIGILGLTYKPGTDTLRRSKSLELAKLLQKKGAVVRAYDPVVKKLSFGSSKIHLTEDIESFFLNLDLVILMTPWPQFKEIKATQVLKMKNVNIIDTANILNSEIVTNKKVNYWGTGIKYEKKK